jgi:hypothetical protein
MNLYLDTEFNGHGGELISLALAAPNGENFYGVYNFPNRADPWVAEHVLPKLFSFKPFGEGNDPGVTQPVHFREKLHRFLKFYANAHIFADWPHDFAHFMNCLAGPSYDQALDYQCTMHLIKTPPGEPKPEVPHNALSDAIALMKWHQRWGSDVNI